MTGRCRRQITSVTAVVITTPSKEAPHSHTPPSTATGDDSSATGLVVALIAAALLFVLGVGWRMYKMRRDSTKVEAIQALPAVNVGPGELTNDGPVATETKQEGDLAP